MSYLSSTPKPVSQPYIRVNTRSIATRRALIRVLKRDNNDEKDAVRPHSSMM